MGLSLGGDGSPSAGLLGEVRSEHGKPSPIPVVGVDPSYRSEIGLTNLPRVILLMSTDEEKQKQKDPCAYGDTSPDLPVTLPISPTNICTASPAEDLFSLSSKDKNKINESKNKQKQQKAYQSCHHFYIHYSKGTGRHAGPERSQEGVLRVLP